MANVQLLGCWFVALFAACAVPEGELPSLSTSEQKLVDFGPNILSLQPVGYWRLNETSGTTMQDSSPTGIDGTYSAGPSQSLLLNQPGGVYWDTSSRAVMFKGTAGSAYGQIPDHRVLSLARAWDNFSRTYPSFPYTWDTNWGSAPDGQSWFAEVSPGNYYRSDGNVAIIDPKGNSGTFQQGLNTSLLTGQMQVRSTWSAHAQNGDLRPVSLVAQYVSNHNFMRAELVENSNHALKIQIVKQSGGGSGTILAQSTVKDSNGATAVYNLNDWWYLRFEFDGNKYRARAWKMGTLQYNPLTQAADDPDTQTDEGCAAGGRWQVCATAGSASSGTIGIRTSNSDGSARPVVQFEGLWVQTIGFSIHMLLQIPEAQNNAPSSGQLYGRYKYNIFGKGTDGTNREYTFRYHDDDCPAPPHMPSDCHPGEYHLKAYINSLEGLKGAGVDYAVTQPTAPDDPNRAQITGGTDSIIDNYLQVVFMFDPGDALDPSAGVSLYVNGEKVGGPDPASPAGPRYNGTVDCQDSIDTPIADPQLALWGYPGVPGACTGGQCSFKSRVDTRIVCSTSADCGGRPCEIPLETGGSQKYCRVRYLCSEGTGCNCGSDGYCKENCWDIYPLNGNAPLRIGQRDPVDGETFSGWFEELAIFSRKLTDLEIAKLREWQQP